MALVREGDNKGGYEGKGVDCKLDSESVLSVRLVDVCGPQKLLVVAQDGKNIVCGENKETTCE